MLCRFALLCTNYCITHMICTVTCQEIEMVRFLSLFQFYVVLIHVNWTANRNSSKKYRFS